MSIGNGFVCTILLPYKCVRAFDRYIRTRMDVYNICIGIIIGYPCSRLRVCIRVSVSDLRFFGRTRGIWRPAPCSAIGRFRRVKSSVDESPSISCAAIDIRNYSNVAEQDFENSKNRRCDETKNRKKFSIHLIVYVKKLLRPSLT